MDNSIARLTIKTVTKIFDREKTVALVINDVNLRAELDTGVDVNVMDETPVQNSC